LHLNAGDPALTARALSGDADTAPLAESLRRALNMVEGRSVD